MYTLTMYIFILHLLSFLEKNSVLGIQNQRSAAVRGVGALAGLKSKHVWPQKRPTETAALIVNYCNMIVKEYS